MRTAHHRYTGAGRRGTVLVMVLAILAMLFMMGSSLLIVSRFEQQTVKQKDAALQMKVVLQGLFSPLMRGLREDLVGSDNEPYNSSKGAAGWGGDPSLAEDFADLAGVHATLPPHYYGDLLLSTPEPYLDPLGVWRWFSLSWQQDAVIASGGTPPANHQEVFGGIWQAGLPYEDADGDGIRDSIAGIGGEISAAFGGGYDPYLRMIPHGGMVLLDRMTHPALLRQVIHYDDVVGTASVNDLLTELWVNDPLSIDTANDEWKLRRRGFLPPRADVDVLTSLPGKLTTTLGYYPSNTNEPHWWLVDPSAAPAEQAWWVSRMTPSPLGLTEVGYNGNNDTYDRRRLVTTINSDDVLRRQRDENALANFKFKPTPSSASILFSDIVSPPSVGPSSPYSYGTVKSPVGSQYVVAFNREGLRTTFSLRDVLDPAIGPPVTPKEPYRRAVQLTAYYLAMLQHVGITTDEDQLLNAAQLAVNTIDFADADDTPSYFAFSAELPGPTTVDIKVVGVEKQPFITEAYAQVVVKSVSDGVGGFMWGSTREPDRCVYAVELHNPYAVALDLGGFSLKLYDDSGVATLVSLDSVGIPAGGHVVCVNRANDDTRSLSMFIPGGNATSEAPNTYPILSGVVIGDNTAVELIYRANKLYDLSTATIGSVSSPVVVDRIKPLSVSGLEALPTPENPNQPVWAGLPEHGDVVDVGGGGQPVTPGAAGEYLVRECSLQRFKRTATPGTAWRCTLGRQQHFSRVWSSNAGSIPAQQHSLLGSDANGNQVAVKGNAVLPQDAAPFEVVTANRGTNLTTGGTRAFPTTGSLLLVTRYAHIKEVSVNGTPTISDKPITEQAAEKPPDSNAANAVAQMKRIDNGHMPVFAVDQRCKDADPGIAAGRLNQPWGQLVYDYFTALPLEELVRPIDLSGPPLYLAADAQFIDAAKIPAADYDRAWNHLFAGYPVVERVDLPGGDVTIGPRVRGRININFASWWVLDGLPVLPDFAPPPVGTPYNPLAYLPTDDLVGKTPAAPTEITSATVGLVDGGVMDFGPTVSPKLAQAIALYRELRNVPRVPSGTIAVATTEGPGFPTVGKLANVIGMALKLGPYDAPPPSYTYLEAVAPLVRLTDWATVKNHAYTLYATIGDSSSPQVWIHTQTTVDRTRCMYTFDEPKAVSEILPLGYYNAIADQE
ncbi:MAG: hypothetical protein JXA69_01500 [Phycisphaerae bacterium]|nr:hypothetical protein [Phycisphaerae bacterium]